MYRIRRESGEEVTLGSIDEFGAAVAAGIVTAKAEIFHARAEKWLPIASHPHFKMAHDRVTASVAQKPAAKTPVATGSGQRPAVNASGQRPAAPQLRVMRTDVAPVVPVDGTVSQKSAPRWNSAQRPAARAVAPKLSAPPPQLASDLHLVLADTLLSGAATAPALPEFELLPEIEAPEVVEPVSAAPVDGPVAGAPAASQPVPVPETGVEHAPANVVLVSHEEKPATARHDVEIINPDRTMPVVTDRELSPLDIPAPIRDFTPADTAREPAARPASKTPLFIGVGLVAAAVLVIGFFAIKLSSAPSAPDQPSQTTAARSRPEGVPKSAPVPIAPVATTAPPTGVSTGLGGDLQGKKPRKQGDDASAGTSDGLEPPPVVIPAAPKLGKIGDAATLPTVDVGVARNDAMARAQALEKARRAIDSSMRSNPDSQ
jgi:hypothetical protein